jgi:hypothetical protein
MGQSLVLTQVHVGLIAALAKLWFWVARGLQGCRAYGAGRDAFDFSARAAMQLFFLKIFVKCFDAIL